MTVLFMEVSSIQSVLIEELHCTLILYNRVRVGVVYMCIVYCLLASLISPVMGADFPKPEIKVVTADKIFDVPGRSERPSHVR